MLSCVHPEHREIYMVSEIITEALSITNFDTNTILT